MYIAINEQGTATGFATDKDLFEPGTNYITRNRIESVEHANKLAAELTAHTDQLFLGLDRGRHVSPQFDVFKAPVVGDEVSKGFNGDYYPCGKITSISKTMKKIVTANGTVFYRRGQSATWLNYKTFAMVPGIHNERNPHF